jgi:[acyl-carrier-protein] S-malonyltransferase
LVELGPGGVLSSLARRVVPELSALSVTKPDDLDTLMDTVAAPDLWRSEPQQQGEHLYMSERVVVSPSAGIFSPEPSLFAPGAGLLPGTGDGGGSSTIGVGDLVGRVGVVEVRTPFAGQVVRWLGAAGERVQEGQPLLWLRMSEDAT